MPLYKTVFSFISSGTGGGRWSEVYYRAKATLAEAANFTPLTIDRRLAILNNVSTWTKVRVSQVGAPRITTTVTINRIGLPGFSTSAPENTGESHVIVLASSARPATRRLWLRGLYTGNQFRNSLTGNWELGPLANARINSWVNQLGSANFSGAILARKPAGVDGIINRNIVQIDGTAADGTSIITLDGDALVLAGGQLAISGVSDRRLPGLAGSFTVLASATPNYTINYAVPTNAVIIPTRGTVRKLEYYEDALIDRDISGWAYGGVRQTKNDFTGSRGAFRKQNTRKSR